MAKGELLGHIDCPTCKTKDGMRITADKNGDPFGYCDADCDQQMRIGGKAHRVKKFFEMHPHIKRPGEAPPIPQPASSAPVAPTKVDATEAKQAPAAAIVKGAGTAPEKQKPKSSSWAPLIGRPA